jgi:hypothetical protein
MGKKLFKVKGKKIISNFYRNIHILNNFEKKKNQEKILCF